MTALSGLDGRRDVHGLVAGRVVRLLADGGVLSPQEAADRFAAALSVGVQAADKAQWAEGFLSGSGLLLAHDRDLLAILDGWVASLSAQEFLDVLPLLRRTFGEFAQPERSSIGRAARHLSGGGGHRSRRRRLAAAPRDGAGDADEIDAERAAGALRTVAMILTATSERASMSAQDRDSHSHDPRLTPERRRMSASGCGAGGCCSARPPTRAALACPQRIRPSMRRWPRSTTRTPGGRRGRSSRLLDRADRAIGRARRVRPEGGALAGRHPHLLPVHGRAGDAAGRDRPA